MQQPTPTQSPLVHWWIFLCMTLVVLMVAIGGATRLTESGLSIVEWDLVTGTLPPLNESDWQAQFDAYKTSPQYRYVNHGFSLEDFKKIFWLEYLHRLLGRIIGLMVIVPYLLFVAAGTLSPRMKKRGLALCLLVVAQGTVGWIMVASGLNTLPRVEPVKLALHLSLAFVFFCVLAWTYWQLKGYPRYQSTVGFWARLLFLIIFVQIIFGALVAGLDAGLTYNTFPMMDGELVPVDLHKMQPWWRNHLESVLTVQFQHRAGAVVIVLASFCFFHLGWGHSTPDEKRWLKWLMLVVLLQFGLGVATLLSVVNIYIAVAHQMLALLLLTVALRLTYQHADI